MHGMHMGCPDCAATQASRPRHAPIIGWTCRAQPAARTCRRLQRVPCGLQRARLQHQPCTKAVPHAHAAADAGVKALDTQALDVAAQRPRCVEDAGQLPQARADPLRGLAKGWETACGGSATAVA